MRSNTNNYTRTNKRLFIQLACILLSVTVLLCGCAQKAPDPGKNSSSSQTATPSQDPLTAVKQWLEKDCSFDLSYQYMNLLINGVSQQIVQTFAADGSWSFISQQKVWDHTSNYESERNGEYYYRYEDSQFICYCSFDGNAPERFVLTDRDIAEIEADRPYVSGVPALLPDYMQDFSVTEANGAAVFTFQLPVEKVLEDNTMLSKFVTSVFSLSGAEYKPEYNAKILCTFESDPQTFQPKALSYDFSQIKPYVLSSGAQSGEYALDADFVTMTYTFDYALPDTTEIPAHMIPETAGG